MTDVSTAQRDGVIDVLNAAFVHRFHSLAEYIVEAGPYVQDGDQLVLKQIKTIAAFDREEAEHLADLIESLDGIPQAPPYEHFMAELNYLSLRYLRDVLREHLGTQLAELRSQLPRVQSCRPAREALKSLCDTLSEQIEALSLDLSQGPRATA